MKRFYFPHLQLFKKDIPYPLKNKEIYRHFKARRIEEEIIIFFNGLGQSAKVQIYREKKHKEKEYFFQILSFQKHTKDKPNLNIYLPVLENNRQSFLLSKLTELGINMLLFYKSDFTQKRKLNTQRWKQIAISAAEQSGRYYLPKFFPAQGELPTLKDYLSHWKKRKSFIIPGLPNEIPLEKDKKLLAKFSGEKSKGISLLIGPEGGFSRKEINALKSPELKGIVHIHSFHHSVLRVETAAIALTAIIKNKFYQH